MEDAFKKKIQATLKEPAEKLAKGLDLHILRIDVRGTEQTPVIEVILDGPRLVAVGDCETVSKELNNQIEAGKLIKGNFRLDVLSPGTEEPLVEDWQFQRSIGRLIEVHYRDGEEHHTVHGTLKAYDTKSISLEPIHVGSKKAAPVPLKDDEQLYEKPVALVLIEREHLTKVLVTLQFKR